MTSVPQSDNAPRLVFSHKREPHTFTLDKGQVWTIGRSFENQVVIDDASISRKHAMMQRLENGDIYLVDLGSSNGTLVNERRVTVPVTLRSGDRITFGKTECQFTVPDAPPRMTPDLFSSTAAGMSTQILQERRLLTVTVVDVLGFTALTRQISEQVLSGVMGYWFQHASRITQQSGGWIDKYIGDAIMALWAHDEDDPSAHHAERWMWALAEIGSMTAQVARHFSLPAPLRVGAGVNTGFAVMSNTGSRDRPDYTAIGDTVNIAFRLEAATRTIDRDVLVGERSWKEISKLGVGDRFTHVEVALKGYEGLTSAYASDFSVLQEISTGLSDVTTRHNRETR